MAPQEIGHDPGFYVGLGIQALAIFVLLALVVTGIVIAVRAKSAGGKGCGIAMAVVFGLQVFLVTFWVLINIAASLSPASNSGGEKFGALIRAKDNSCEISVPASWIEAPDLNKDAVLGVKDPLGSEYALVLVDTKEDYKGSLADYAHDTSNRMRDKLTSPRMELPQSLMINGKSAIRQVLHGEIDHLRITYVNTYYEGEARMYQLISWSLESKGDLVRSDFEKIAQSFRERTADEK
jgi:dihydrofolate reductase